MIWLDQVSMIWLDKEEKASAAALSLPSGHNPGATMLRYGANDPNRPWDGMRLPQTGPRMPGRRWVGLLYVNSRGDILRAE